MIHIKKYSNRRLYDTENSRYVNLGELAELIRGGETIQVSDVKTGEDLTHGVLLQILLEEQGGGALLPPSLLHRIIRSSVDHPVQKLILQQISAGMELLEAQLSALEKQFPTFKQRAAAAARGAAAPPPEPEPAPEEGGQDAELAALRERLAALEKRLTR
ncbi:MAG: hypothetical protein EP330_06910 [Deltaproteobacteria bacterium]|nr:MAG: hypothetical protein EP330_06910 [Deltaproteobacteria bacterium]